MMGSNQSYQSMEPGSDIFVIHGILDSGGSEKQIGRVSYPSPAAGKAYIKKIFLHNSHATNAAVITLWDEDTTNSTPVQRGSNAAPLFKFNLAALSQVAYGPDQLPREFFQAGFVMQSDNVNVEVSIEYVQTIG